MKQVGIKKVADKDKILYCKELKLYCTATTDTKHKWVEVNKDAK